MEHLLFVLTIQTNAFMFFTFEFAFNRLNLAPIWYFRNTCEDLAIRAKEQAERCQLDKVEELAGQCGELINRVASSMAQLQRGIEVALFELDKFEGT